MTIIKRTGEKATYDEMKIYNALYKAFEEVDEVVSTEDENVIKSIVKEITNDFVEEGTTVELLQDEVEDKLMESDRKDVARAYVRYRYKRELVRETNATERTILEMLGGENEYWNTENSNKNPKLVNVQKDYISGIVSTDLSRKVLLPKEVVEAHDAGLIHFHDMDYFLINAETNCELVNLEDMLQNGTVLNGKMIEKPHRFITACTIATQIILGVTSSTYGGCSITLTHLAPFVRDSYYIFLNKYLKRGLDKETATKFAREDTKKEIEDGCQTFFYQTNSCYGVNGQSPFLSVFMYLGETEEYKEELAAIIKEMLKQRIIGIKNEKGVYVTPEFPKLLYVLEEDNIHEDSKYWYLTKLAAKSTAKRMSPDYISEKKMFELKEGNCFPCMGCRSFLSPWKDENGSYKFYGRFNVGVVTVNLVDVALTAKTENRDFWEVLDERCELCHLGLKTRIKRLENTKSDVAPLLWQHGALARLNKGETLYNLIHNGYASASLGYAGLYECVKAYTGESHSGGYGKEFGLKVMKFLNDKCEEWKELDNVGYSTYGSPIENTTYKFAQKLQKRFGKIEGITDRDYITNSYHINVREEIDPFSKFAIESEYQALSLGGAISYCETSGLTENIPAVLKVVQFIYDNIMYAELNCKSDYCMECGFDGEILLDENLEWYCPNCGNRDHDKMSVARRTCGLTNNQ